VQPPFELNQQITRLDGINTAPEINGVKPQHYSFSINGQHCFDVIAVKGLLGEVTESTRAFNLILASNSAETLSTLPADMQNPCMLSKSIFSPNVSLEYGFALREWDATGKSRALIDFKEDHLIDKTLFELPEGYKRFSMKDYREGKVDFSE
jgi:hypothetical protein